MEATFAIIGGGISGVSCAESIAFLAPEEKIVLISASPVIKKVTNIVALGKTLEQFDVEETPSSFLTSSYPLIDVIHDIAKEVDINKKIIITDSGKIITFKKLCVCSGARPKMICENNSRVIGIRDTESVANFVQKLKDAKKIIVVGNGGIATELVHEIKGVDIVWVIKDKHISATFVDAGAAEFFQEKLSEKDVETENKPMKRIRYTVTNKQTLKEGPALGPDWHSNFQFKDNKLSNSVLIECQSEILKIIDPSESNNINEDWPVYAQLSCGKVI